MMEADLTHVFYMDSMSICFSLNSLFLFSYEKKKKKKERKEEKKSERDRDRLIDR